MRKHLKIPQNHGQQTNKQTDNRHISSIWYSLTIHLLFKDVFKYMITPCLQPCLRHVYTHVYTKFTPMFTAYLKICLNHIWEYIRRILVDMTLCLNTWLHHVCLNACLFAKFKNNAKSASNVWSCLILFGPIWLHLTSFGPISSHLAPRWY